MCKFVVSVAAETNPDIKLKKGKGLGDKFWHAIANGLSCNILVIDGTKKLEKSDKYTCKREIFAEPFVVYKSTDQTALLYIKKHAKVLAEG